MQETILRELGLCAQETSLFQLPLGTQCIWSLCSEPYRACMLAHVFWGHYCVRIQLDSGPDAELPVCVLALRKMLESLEPLTTD